jgi:ATP-dependent DNA helicase RecG
MRESRSGVDPRRVLLAPARSLGAMSSQELDALDRLELRSVLDLALHLPFRYEDRSAFHPIAELAVGEICSVRGQITGNPQSTGFGKKRRVTASLTDGTGILSLVWFNRPHVAEGLRAGKELIVSGKVDFRANLQMVNAEIVDPHRPSNFKPLKPMYHTSAGLQQFRIARFARQAADKMRTCEPLLPESLLERWRIPSFSDLVLEAHAPRDGDRLDVSRRTLARIEYTAFRLAVEARRARLQKVHVTRPMPVAPELDQRIRARFPFALSSEQSAACAEVAADLAQPYPMNRLLQGDVGAGKTAVAVYAILAAVAAGGQAAFVAPTEVLARQHLDSLRTYLDGSRVNIGYLAGSLTSAERDSAVARAASGEDNLIVGTHALLEEDVRFADLRLAVIDEQHKFGVRQRGALSRRGKEGAGVHLLVMSATPIPRSLGLTVFGDLDISSLRTRLPGRQPVTTRWVSEAKRAQAYQFVEDRLSHGERVYVVSPLVSDREGHKVRSAETVATQLRDVFPDRTIALLHGQMSPLEKDEAMEKFRDGRVEILVATIVIEVGIDVPEATVMIIEHAERFGLATLHQLRGRIGRGDKGGVLLLMGEPDTDEARQRLRTLVETDDGFEIAEQDLRLRGFGDVLGARQAGMPSFRCGDPTQQSDLLAVAIEDARWLRGLPGKVAFPESGRVLLDMLTHGAWREGDSA